MLMDIRGEPRKVACGPCIRGHRSTKCEHRDRVLLEVRKPGRPLSSCPHPSASCNCAATDVSYIIPKGSTCRCPSNSATSRDTHRRAQKQRSRNSVTNIPAGTVESTLNNGQVADVVETPQGTSPSLATFAPADSSSSNGGSQASSVDLEPSLGPLSRRQSYYSGLQTQLPLGPMPISKPGEMSVVNGSTQTLARRAPDPILSQVEGGLCGNTSQQLPNQAPAKSCCGKPKQEEQLPQSYSLDLAGQPFAFQDFGRSNSFSLQQPHAQPMANGPMYGAQLPIHNHLGPLYQEGHSTEMGPPQQQPSTAVNLSVKGGTCDCGDGCRCFACDVHPANETMMKYIGSMHQYQVTGTFGGAPAPTYDLPSHARQSELLHGSPQNAEFGQNREQYSSFPVGSIYQMELDNAFNEQANATPVWSSGTVRPPFNDSLAGETPRRHSLMTENTSMAINPSTSSDSPDEDNDNENAPILSPSGYVLEQVTLGGCMDPNGTCFCGDGCMCLGCSFHHGHNGVPLPSPTTAPPDPYAQSMRQSSFGDLDFGLGPGLAQSMYPLTPFSTAPT